MRKAVLDGEKASFESGNKYAVFMAIVFAAAGREALPEWARDSLRATMRALERGEIGDLNEAFGWTKKGEFNKKYRVDQARKFAKQQQIFLDLWEARRNGDGMTAVTFEAIAERLGVGRSMVQKVWGERKEELLRVSPGDPKGNHAYIALSFWDP